MKEIILTLLLTTISILPAEIEPYTRLSTISSPKSPLPNTWGAYKTDAYTGSFTYNYDIKIPKGQDGTTPVVNVSYNSHLSKSHQGWMDAGWNLNAYAYVQRDIEYTRKDTSDDTFDLYWFGLKYDLVQTSSSGTSTTFKASYGEKFSKIKRYSSNGGISNWKIETIDGKEYEFMEKHTVNSSDNEINYGWRWSLNTYNSSNGSVVSYYYNEVQGTNDKGAIYLKGMSYNMKKVEFIWEDRPNPYLYIDQGSEVQYGKRLKEIIVSDRKPSEHILSKYVLNYEMNTINTKSLLASIEHHGKGGVSYPPLITDFSYTQLDKTFGNEKTWHVADSVEDKPLRKSDSDSNDLVIDMVDMNGDGLVDYIYHDKSSENRPWDIYINQTNEGENSFADNTHSGSWDVNENIREMDSDGDIDGMLKDMNRDGFVDYVIESGNNLRITFNDEGNDWGETVTWNIPSEVNGDLREIDDFNDNGDTKIGVERDLIDITGDGIPDIVANGNDKIYVWRGEENGFGSKETWDFPDEYLGVTENGELDKGLFDINNDGLIDYIDADSRNWRIWLNTGSNFVSMGSSKRVQSHIISAFHDGRVDEQLMDINGDGFPDYVKGDDRYVEININSGGNFDTNQIEWDIGSDRLPNDYIRATENNGMEVVQDYIDMNGDGLPDIVRKEGGTWKVRFNQSSGADLLNFIKLPYGGKVDIEYKSSREFHNEHLPYNQMIVSAINEINGLTNDHKVESKKVFSYQDGWYDYQNREFRGFRIMNLEDSNMKKTKIYFYQDDAKKGKVDDIDIKDMITNTTLKKVSNTYESNTHSYGGVTIYNIFLEKVTTNIKSNEGYTSESREYVYDNYGNIEEVYNKGLLELGDELFIKRDFINETNFVCREKFYDDNGGALLKEIEYYYDGQNTLCNEVNKYNMTKKVVKSQNGSSFTYVFTYDVLGRLIHKVDSNGNTTTYTYAHSWNTLPTQKYVNVSGVSHIEKMDYDAFDNVLRKQNASGTMIITEYDDFYRVKKIVQPGDTSSSPSVYYEYDIGTSTINRMSEYTKYLPSLSSTYIYNAKHQYMDGFGRLIQTIVPAYSDVIGVTNTFYDSLGRVKKSIPPRGWSDNSGTYHTESVSDSNAGVSYEYDALDRVIKTEDVLGNQNINQYNGWNISTYHKALGSASIAKRKYEFNANKKLTKMTEYSSYGDRVTNYKYSSLGEMTSIEDQEGNQWSYQYDVLSNLISFSDPDRGNHTFIYDGEGNQVSHTDAKGITVLMDYDEINRIKRIHYPRDKDVSFVYDREKVGTLSEVIGNIETTKFKYDDMLRKIEENITIDNLSWVTRWSYDSKGNVMTMTTPDANEVQYSYNEAMLTSQIAGVVDYIDYSFLGQYSGVTFSNRSRVGRNIDERTYKISDIQLYYPSLGWQYDKKYRYDSIGNMVHNIDYIFGDINYEYDDLNQLIAIDSINGRREYSYDTLSNITNIIGEGKNYSFSHNHLPSVHQVSQFVAPPVLMHSYMYVYGNKADISLYASGTPSEMMISLSSNFINVAWQPFSSNFVYNFTNNNVGDILYIKLRNSKGASEVVILEPIFDADRDGIPDFEDSDDDNDGISDSDEIANGLDPFNPSDAQADYDGDGFSNSLEISFGTNIRNKNSKPKWVLIPTNDGLHIPVPFLQ